jgi:hypothetical protein
MIDTEKVKQIEREIKVGFNRRRDERARLGWLMLCVLEVIVVNSKYVLDCNWRSLE